MKPLLLDPERSPDPSAPLVPGAEELVEDLGLDAVFDAMGRGDAFVREIARHTLLSPPVEPPVVRWRLDAFEDARAQAAVVEELYATVLRALEDERSFWGFGHSPSSLLYRAVRVMGAFADALDRLRGIAEERGAAFRSPAFVRFFGMLRSELDPAYLARIRQHLARLGTDGEAVVSAQLGSDNRGADLVLRLPFEERESWWRRHLGSRRSEFSFEIGERDEAGARALSELRDQGYASVARAMARSTEHLLGFFRGLRGELAFYRGAVHFADALAARGLPVGRPDPLAPRALEWEAESLYDPGLALRSPGPIVSNRFAGDGRRLVLVTGPNQGGKTTFLRSLGTAQLLMQAGGPVPAGRFRAAVAPAVATHFARGEDASLTRGRLDGELARMAAIAGRLSPGALLLSNESFSATNEREGSEIADQVFRAAVDSGVRVVAVTHFFELARTWRDRRLDYVEFLRAERTADGTRTFRIQEGEPLATSFGADVYRDVFGEPPPVEPFA